MTYVRCLAQFLLVISLMGSQYALAAPSDAASVLARPKPVAPVGGQCNFNFSDTYYQANSSTPPSVPSAASGFQATQGPILQLQFSSNSSTDSSALPCDGYYTIAFSVELRNDSGLSCHNGLNTVAVWVTSTDPSMPNVLGYPTRYYNSNSTSIEYGQYRTDGVSGNYNAPNAGATFNDWVQCAWGSNWYDGNRGGCCGGRGIKAFPLFMYTDYWAPDGSDSVYNFYYWPAPNARIPYGGFCLGSGNRSWGCTGIRYFQNVGPLATSYCTSKLYTFKTTVLLHRGATVKAPAFQSMMGQNPYTGTSGGDEQAYNNATCAMSVVGGMYSITYSHP